MYVLASYFSIRYWHGKECAVFDKVILCVALVTDKVQLHSTFQFVQTTLYVYIRISWHACYKEFLLTGKHSHASMHM